MTYNRVCSLEIEEEEKNVRYMLFFIYHLVLPGMDKDMTKEAITAFPA